MNTIDSIKEMLSKVLGQKVSMWKAEESNLYFFSLQRPLSISIDEAIERAYEKNR